MVTINPAWPLVTVNADFTTGPPNLPGVSAMSLNAPARRNAVRQIAVQRGRQYELDQCQAGTATLTIVDPLEQLHPSNTSSPFNTGGNTITAYRACQVGAWWNPATGSVAGNLLNAANGIPGVTYGFDPSFETWDVGGGPTVSTGATFAVSTDHTDGTHTVWKSIMASTSAFVSFVPRATPGQVYVLTVDVWANTGVVVGLSWTGNAPVSTATTTTGSFQTLTLTFTADTVGVVKLAVNSASGGFPATFYTSNYQLAGASPGWVLTGSPVQTYSTVIAQTGQYSLANSMPTSAARVSLPLPTAPGVTYTFSAYTAAQGAGTVATLTINGASVSTTTTGAMQRLVLTFVARDAVTLATWSGTASAFPAVFYIDNTQLEIAAAVSAFTASGPTFYPIYSGYVERYPLQWDMAGTRGIRPLTCVDALSVLSRTEITQSYQATILADQPSIYVPYNDASLPAAAQLPSGGQPWLGYTLLPAVGGGEVNFQGDTTLDGSAAVSASEQNTTPPGNDSTRESFVGVSGGLITMNPQSFTLEMWVRFSSGAAYWGAASMQAGEVLPGGNQGPQFWLGWYTDAGRASFRYTDPNGGTTGLHVPNTGWLGFPDGQWHYLALVMLGGNTFQRTIDTFAGVVVPYGFTPSVAVGVNNFFVEVTTAFGDPISGLSIADLAAYPTPLSTAQLSAHYNRGAGFINEVSGARVARLLGQYWAGPMRVAAGKRLMAEDYSYDTRFMLDVLQEIQETERGLIFADASGTLVFEDSTTRYVNNLASRWVFGENPPGASPAEFPYLVLEEDFDPTYSFSQTNLTRPDNSNFAPLPIPLPTNPPLGQRVLTQQVQVNTDFDLFEISKFYLKRYAAPTIRVDTLTLNPAANPALWPVVLSLEISQRITVTRRTSAGLTTKADYYVEQISHDVDIEAGTWTVDLQCSPVFNTSAWILGDPTYGVLGSTTVPVF